MASDPMDARVERIMLFIGTKVVRQDANPSDEIFLCESQMYSDEGLLRSAGVIEIISPPQNVSW